MITRHEAITTLYTLINSGILDEDLEDNIREIANAIEKEKEGYHVWGADDEEYKKMVVLVREDLITKEYLAERRRIHEKYSFTPSKHEEKELKELWGEEEL